MQLHAGKHLENSRKAKPDSRGALGLRSQLFEPLGVVCEKIELWEHLVGGGERAAEKKLGIAGVDCASSPLHLDNLC